MDTFCRYIKTTRNVKILLYYIDTKTSSIYLL